MRRRVLDVTDGEETNLRRSRNRPLRVEKERSGRGVRRSRVWERERRKGDRSSVLSKGDVEAEAILRVTSWEVEVSVTDAIRITSQYSTTVGVESLSSSARRTESIAIAGEGHSEEWADL